MGQHLSEVGRKGTKPHSTARFIFGGEAGNWVALMPKHFDAKKCPKFPSFLFDRA